MGWELGAEGVGLKFFLKIYRTFYRVILGLPVSLILLHEYIGGKFGASLFFLEY